MNINGDLMYRRNIKIIDENGFAETKFQNKPKIYYIQFVPGSKTKNEDSNKKIDIFSKTKIESNLSINYEKDTIKVSIDVPIFTIYRHFVNLLAYILKIHIDSLKNNRTSLNLYPITNELIETSSFIGDVDYEFTVVPSDKPRSNGYENLSIPYIEKLNDLIVNSNKDYIINPRITEIKYALYNTKSINQGIDVVQLMNINTVSEKFHRILLQSEKMNRFKNESKHGNWIVKSKFDISDPLFGIDLIDNSCIFYENRSLSEKHNYIHFAQINFLENGIITLVFRNLDYNQKYEDLCTVIEEWIDKNVQQILKDVHLEEAIYDMNFNFENYKYLRMNLNFNVNIPTKNNISNLTFINNIFNSRQMYSMKSSFRTITNQQFGDSTDLLIDFMGNFTDTFPSTDVTLYYNSVINLNNTTNGIYVSISNSTSFDLFIKFIVMLLNKLEVSKSEGKNKSAASDSIKKYLVSIDQKTRLNQLKDTDPVLFSNKISYGKDITYSQLVQNNQQRPSIITKAEYEILKKDIPDQVINIENQTTHERLYLTCPYDDFPIVNYHHIKDQGCIVKCTTIVSNENQYSYCDSELNGLGNKKINAPETSSAMLVKFSSLLSPRRKCSLPKKLINIFPKCFLIKLDTDININDYMMMNYNLFPFIIEVHDDFYLLPNEFIPGNKFGIVFRESIKDGYLLMCYIDSRLPYVMEDTDTNTFVQQLIQTSKSRNNFSYLIHYINDVFDLSIDETISIGELSDKLSKNNYSFISNKDRIFMIYNKNENKFLSTPIFINPLVNITKYEDLSQKINIFDHLYKLDDLKIKNISKIYVDLESNSAVGVRYFGIDTFIQATKHFKYIGKPLEYIDFTPFKFKIFGIEPEVIEVPKIKDTIIQINRLVRLLISIYLKAHPKIGFNINKDEFKSFFKNNLGESNELVTINNQISWRKSKIKTSLIDKKNFNRIGLIRLFYENIKDSYNVSSNPNEIQYKLNFKEEAEDK